MTKRRQSPEVQTINEAACVICRCVDSRACPDGCSWMLVDRAKGIGVCSTERCVRLALRRLAPRPRRRRASR